MLHFFDDKKVKKSSIFCNIKNVFTVTFNQFNVTLLNKSIDFFQTIVLSNKNILIRKCENLDAEHKLLLNFLFCTEQTCICADNNVLFGHFYLLINVPKGSLFNISALLFSPFFLNIYFYLKIHYRCINVCCKHILTCWL